MIQTQSENNLKQRRIIGLDMHPDVFTAAALEGNNPHTAQVLWTHHRLPQADLEKWLAKHVHSTDLIVIEASANTFSVVQRIEKSGCHAIILESQRAGKIGKTYCNNDKISAVKLARIYLSGLATTVWKPDEATHARREIFHAHARTVKDTTRARNRIKSFLNEHSLRLKKNFRLTDKEAAKQLLALKNWSPLQQLILTQQCQALQQAEERRKQLRSIMAEEIVQNPDMLRLIRLFGLRHITAFALVAFIGDIRRFRTPKQLVAYIGVNPSVNDSGNTKGSSDLKHHGCRPLRALLIQSAKTMMRLPNPLQKWGQALAFRRGKNRATVALARKLVVACWYLMQGLFTHLQEITNTLKIKIQKLVTAIGHQRIKELGYSSKKIFKQKICNHLLNFT